MALIDCPECGSRISSDSRACPDCGKIIRRGQFDPPSTGMRIVHIIIVLLFIIFAIIAASK